ncbi:MAG: hypothetical protein AB7O68_16790 [Pirellulales bacterium]
MLKLLGTLPASDSPTGSLNKLDLVKTLRFGLVVLGGAFLFAFGQSIFGHCDPAVTGYCDLSSVDGTLKTVVQDATQAGISAFGAAALELFRRLLVSN